jgi:DNA-binding NarL/FixJ family response regulator
MADDHAVVRAGFRALIEQAGGYKILAECATASEARRAVQQHLPEMLVLDISLPGGGLTLVPDMRASYPNMTILILSMHSGEPYVSEAFRQGVTGYVSKGAAADELIAALKCVAEGGRYLSSDLRSDSVETGLAMLSERERVVFLKLAQGGTPKQVALDLGISVKTAYLHRASIREKLGIQTDLQLHHFALSRGLLR